MFKRLAILIAVAAMMAALPATGWTNSTAPMKTLTAFASEAELAALLKSWAEEAKQRPRREMPSMVQLAGGMLSDKVKGARLEL